MQTPVNRLPGRHDPIAAPLVELDAVMRRPGDAFARGTGGLDTRMGVDKEGKRLSVKVDIAGVTKGDMDVTASGDVLTLRATMTDIEEVRDERRGKHLHADRILGESLRSFSLPMNVDRDRTRALYEHGVLVLILTKLAWSSARHIRVS